MAIVTGIVWLACDWAGFNTWVSVGIAFTVGFSAWWSTTSSRQRHGELPMTRPDAGSRLGVRR